MSRFSVVFAVGIILQVGGGILAQGDTVGEVNPCTDILTYACKKNATGSLKRIKLEELLDSYLSKDEVLGDVERKLYTFRKHCAQLDLTGRRNFLEKLNPSAGGWPALNENWKADKFDFQTALAELQLLEIPVVFTIMLRNGADYRNQLHLHPRITDRLFSNNYEQRLKRKLSNLTDNVDEVISDSRIVEALFIAEVNSNDKNVLTDYRGLKREIPEIDWDNHFEIMYGQKVPETFLVEVEQLGLLKRIITKIIEVEPRVMANYLFHIFVSRLPGDNNNISNELFEDFAYDLLRQHFTDETKEQLRGMLSSFLKNLANTVNLFDDEDKLKTEKSINEFVREEILPNIDDSYLKDTYGEVMLLEDNCFATGVKLLKTYWKLRAKIHFKREVDPLNYMRNELRNTLLYHLPSYLDKSSAIHFDVLIWDSLSIRLQYNWNVEKFKPMQQCLENQIDEKLDEYEIKEALKIKIFTKTYFDWAKDKANLMLLEERKYNESSKQVLLERLIARYCNDDRNSFYRLDESTVSGIFGNMKEVSEVFNCPVGSQFDPLKTCELEFVQVSN